MLTRRGRPEQDFPLSRRIAIEIDDIVAQAGDRGEQPVAPSWDGLAEREPRVVSRLARIAAARHWEIIFLTDQARSSTGTDQTEAQRWLESKGFALPSVYVAPGARGPIAAALDLDLVIDARPESCVSIADESDARPILVWGPDRGALPAGARREDIQVMRSLGEVLDMLTAGAEPDERKSGFSGWLRKLFGLDDSRT